MQPDDKDAALLPRRIDGSFALIHRPIGDSGAHIWMSYSPDLRNWGEHKLVLHARRGAWWDANKVGLSPPLIETPRGWLMLYHGVRHDRVGRALPARRRAASISSSRDVCLLRGDSWIFGPEASYERDGRRRQRRVPVRVHDRRGRRHDQPVLRRSRHVASRWRQAASAESCDGSIRTAAASRGRVLRRAPRLRDSRQGDRHAFRLKSQLVAFRPGARRFSTRFAR